VISPPHKWQVRFNSSGVEVIPRIEKPVNPEIVEELLIKFPDFRRAYTEDGLCSDEFDSFPPTTRTLRQFILACHDLPAIIRDQMLPNPDKK
ncbi:MAG: transaldolase family protein, partial [Candidatus Acidiferrum sp.]